MHTHLCPTLTKLLGMLLFVLLLPLLLDVVVAVVCTVAALYSNDSSSAPNALCFVIKTANHEHHTEHDSRTEIHSLHLQAHALLSDDIPAALLIHEIAMFARLRRFRATP
jgi:hypothetical protein